MVFQGFEVIALGNATLELRENKLVVSSIRDSGLDGVLVKSPNNKDFKISMNPLKEAIKIPGAFLKYSPMVKNDMGHILTVQEMLTWYDAERDLVLFGYNYKLLPQCFKLIGYLNDEVKFEIEVNKNNPPAPTIQLLIRTLYWIYQVIAAAATAYTIYDALTEVTHERTPHFRYDEQGNVTREEDIITHDPIPLEVFVDNRSYTVDRFGIKTITDFNPPLSSSEQSKMCKGGVATISGAKIGEIEINSIIEI